MNFKICIFLIFASITAVYGKTIPFSIQLTEPSKVDIIANVDLNKLAGVFSGTPVLYQINSKKRILIPSQLDNNLLTWIIEGPKESGVIKYEIKFVNSSSSSFQMKATKENGQLTIKSGNQNLLNYHFETAYPPAGIDTAYKRSAFIHPLWTPHGQVLTRIQAPDHYHHYGIWNPWTHVLFEGDTLDFWNLKDRKGTVRFAGFTKLTDGSVYSEYEALHQHIAYKKNGSEKVALNEWQKVRVYRPHNDIYVVDITIEYQCASENPFKILEYRYAGLGWRATEEWNNNNSQIITSEGKTRENADGSVAKWFMVQGKLGNDSGGMAMLSFPSNYNHPEPIRIWPLNMNQRGDVFANFAPTKNKDWLLEPGKTYTLKYRFIVFNGNFTADMAQEAWRNYATGDHFQVMPKH